MIIEEQGVEVAEKKMLNGVDVGRLFSMVESIKATPGLAKFSFRAHNKWINGGHNRTTIQNFYGEDREETESARPFVLDSDEPPALLGEDRGVNPVEYVLTALAGCLTTSVIYHAAAQGIRIDEVESDLEGEIDLRGFLGLTDDVRNGYENLRVSFKIKAEASEEKLKELCHLAQMRSPVFDIISNPVPVAVEMKKS
jgi:uncharacterized OsmC-like protein